MKKTFSRLSAVITAAALGAGICSALPTGAAAEGALLESECENLTIKDAEVATKVYNDEYPGYTGDGFVWVTNGGTMSFTVDAPKTGVYRLVTRCLMYLGDVGNSREAAVSVERSDGSKWSKTVKIPKTETWDDYSFGDIKLTEGENTVTFGGGWGYCLYDSMSLTPTAPPDYSKASGTPCDPNATSETKSLFSYLKSIYGSNVLSGQQEIYGGGHGVQTTIHYDAATGQCVDASGKVYDTRDEVETEADDHSKFKWHCWDENGQDYVYDSQNRGYRYNEYDREIKYLKNLTGDAPAIRGFDFGSNCPCYCWDDGVTGRMIDWAVNQNGICTASWHINVPSNKADYTLGEPLDFSKTTYSEKTDFVTANVMKEGTMEYDYFRLAMDNLAKQFLELQEAGVPVLWRPFHEAEGNPSSTSDPLDGSGSWFWWAKEGASVYKDLWKYLYTTLTEEYGIHNLIWEQNLYAWTPASGQWYVGDDWVDIVGFDKYDTQYNRNDGLTSGPNESANSDVFHTLIDYVDGNKMVCMPENSTIPSVPNMTVEYANWLYFCTWYDEESSPKFISGEEYNNADTVKATYQSDYCITLSELPADLYKNGGSSQSATTTKPAETTTTDAGTTTTVSSTTEPKTTTSTETTSSAAETTTTTEKTGESVTTTTTTTTTSGEKPSGDVIYGDVNLDGGISMVDVVYLNKYTAGALKLNDQQTANADCMNDGAVNSSDATALLKYVVKKISELPVKPE